MTLRYAFGCVVAIYRGRECAALAWDGARAIEVVLKANAALGGTASATLADLPADSTSPRMG